jgi:hypothetical protein
MAVIDHPVIAAVVPEYALDRSIKLDIPDNTSLEYALIEWGTKAGVHVMINTNL